MKESLLKALRIKAAEGNDFAVARLKELEKTPEQSPTASSEPPEAPPVPKLAPTPTDIPSGTENSLECDEAAPVKLTVAEKKARLGEFIVDIMKFKEQKGY